MKLSQALKNNAPGNGTEKRRQAVRLSRQRYYEVKARIHNLLVEKMDADTVSRIPRAELEARTREVLTELAASQDIPLNRAERSQMIADLMDEVLGLGPLEGLLADDTVRDILVNGPDSIFVERNGLLQQVDEQFRDDEHLMQTIDRIVSKVGRRVDESSPMVDARLPDGSRVNVVIPPLSLDGPMVSIRKFGQDSMTMDDLIALETLPASWVEYFRAAVRSKLNILISGGTGAGKTTFLNILSGYIPANERIITIEDSAELQLHQPHVGRLESRPANIEATGAVTLTDLVRNSLRMRPDRIIVGESRGGEVIDMLQAMNTGHPGSMSTIHANTPRDAFARMEVMIGMAPTILSEHGARALIAGAIDIIVQVSRLADGRRRLVGVSEIEGVHDETIQTRGVFAFKQESIEEDGRIRGRFVAENESSYREHMHSNGMELDDALFCTEYGV